MIGEFGLSEKSSTDAFVYFLECSDGSLYCGWTVDLEARVAKHNAGTGAKYTRSRRPVWVVCAWQVELSEARRLEARLKKLTRAQKYSVIENGLDYLNLIV